MKKNKYCLTHNKFIRRRNLIVLFVNSEDEGYDYVKNHNKVIKKILPIRKDGKLINRPFL